MFKRAKLPLAGLVSRRLQSRLAAPTRGVSLAWASNSYVPDNKKAQIGQKIQIQINCFQNRLGEKLGGLQTPGRDLRQPRGRMRTRTRTKSPATRRWKGEASRITRTTAAATDFAVAETETEDAGGVSSSVTWRTRPGGASHGSTTKAAALGSGLWRAPGIPEPRKGGGEVEEYEWK